MGVFKFMDTIKKAVLFCRVSSREQMETGYSLPAQEKLLKDYSDKNGFKVNKVFAIPESAGGNKQRKSFNEMLEYLKKNKINILIVEKTDRLTRNMADAVTVNDWVNSNEEKEIHFVKENNIITKNSKSNEIFMWNIKVSMSQFYLNNLSEEIKKGQKEKISDGWLPTKPPYGYKIALDNGHKIHVIDENVGPLVRQMFQLYSNGNYSIKSLSKEIYKIGLRSVSGKMVAKSRIHRLLRDPFYIGKMVWNGKVYQGKQEPLISTDVFNKVQNMLSSKNTPKYKKHLFVFRGLAKCSNCGGTITWEKQKGITYGHCNHYKDCPKQTWSKQKNVEDKLINILDSLKIKSPKLMEWLGKALKNNKQDETEMYLISTKELNKKKEMFKKRLDAIYIDKIDGKISEKYYDEKFKEFTNEIDLIDENITNQTKAGTKTQLLGAKLYDVAQKGGKAYSKKKKINDKRELINLIFEKLEINGEKISFFYSKEFATLSRLINKTNSSKLPKLVESDSKIFELYNLSEISKKYATSQPECSVLLPVSVAPLSITITFESQFEAHHGLEHFIIITMSHFN